jgi:DNA-directed RNA polymerase specialized sigma24 family protein
MGSPTSSFGLLERIREGDRAPFELLFEKHRRRLAILIYYKLDSQLRRTTDVDDILQETLLRAFRGIDTFHYRTPGSFLSWLSRIAEHVLVDEARFEGRQRRDGGEKVQFRSESNPAGPEPADQGDNRKPLLKPSLYCPADVDKRTCDVGCPLQRELSVSVRWGNEGSIVKVVQP